MSGSPNVSTERLSSLLGHVTHRGFDDLVDPKNQGIALIFTGNPDLLITGDPLFYTNLLATLDMFRLNSASLTFGTTDEGNQFRRRQKLTRTKFSCRCTTRENSMPNHRWNGIFVKSKRWLSIILSDLFDTKARTCPSTTRCSSLLALKSLRDRQSSVRFKRTKEA
jgi:hypothetical protein